MRNANIYSALNTILDNLEEVLNITVLNIELKFRYSIATKLYAVTCIVEAKDEKPYKFSAYIVKQCSVEQIIAELYNRIRQEHPELLNDTEITFETIE